MFSYKFQVPLKKQIRMIVHTDCKCESDDQYALAHHLMTPKFDVRGIIAGHFDCIQNRYAAGETAKASYEEIEKILTLMHCRDKYNIFMGAGTALQDENTPIVSQGAEFIVEEALREDERPLFIALQGGITDLASAILMEPEICKHMTAIWIGGGAYPEGGPEFNLMQDITAANIVFGSTMPVWQIPMNVYKQMAVSLAELELKVYPYGEIGAYLFEQMIELNNQYGIVQAWPHGEMWGLGDQGTISVLMEEQSQTDSYDIIPAPIIDKVTMKYIHSKKNRTIRIYKKLNDRLTLEDFFCKLRLNFPEKDS